MAFSWDVASLAALVELSTRQFERRFKAVTGQSPMQYLQRLRLTGVRIVADDVFERQTNRCAGRLQ